MKLLQILLISGVLSSQAIFAPQKELSQAHAENVTNPAPPFSISISLVPTADSQDRYSVRAGGRIFLNIALTNLSDHSIDTPSAWMGGFDAVYNAEIHGPSGAQLTWAPPPTVVFLQSQSGTLDPGKTKNEQIPISEYFDFTKPGIYEIKVKRCIDLDNPVGQAAPKYDESKGVIMSNKFTITVVATQSNQKP
jgi:hypothetical protein